MDRWIIAYYNFNKHTYEEYYVLAYSQKDAMAKFWNLFVKKKIPVYSGIHAFKYKL